MADKSFLNPEGKDNLSATDILDMRKRLFNKYGKKILFKPDSSWPDDEKVASVTYQTLTEQLYKMAPGAKSSDRMWELYIKNDARNGFELIFKYVMKGVWIILPLVVLLALLKFIFH